MLTKHKEVSVSINGGQSVKLGKGTIEFKNYFKQVPVPLKVYADFECNLKSVESYEGSYSKIYQDHIACSFAYKLVCADDTFSKSIVVFSGENAPGENLQKLTKNVCVIFQNLRGLNSYLIFCGLKKFDVKIDVIPNGLGKYMAFISNKT